MTINTELEIHLLEVLRARTGRPDLSYAGEPARLSGGFWAELVAFSLTDPPPGWPAELVARVMPDATFARKETIVQAGIAAAGFRYGCASHRGTTHCDGAVTAAN